MDPHGDRANEPATVRLESSLPSRAFVVLAALRYRAAALFAHEQESSLFRIFREVHTGEEFSLHSSKPGLPCAEAVRVKPGSRSGCWVIA